MKYKSILIILAIIIIASTILSFIPIEQACGPASNNGSSLWNGENEGCRVVQASNYEETLGIKNAHLGLTAFSILFIINFLHIKKPTKKKKQFLIIGLTIGSIMAIYFLTIQFFVLHAICKYCMIADIGTILSLGIILLVKDK
jgi:uncharacterized membrane protein